MTGPDGRPATGPAAVVLTKDLPADADPDGPGGQVGAALVAEARADLGSAAVLAVAALVVGVPLGLLWAVTAPVQLVVLTGSGQAALTDEATHVFDATALFALLATASGVLVGAVAWRLRAHRGPVLLVAAVAGTVAGAWIAARVGVAIAPGAPPVDVLLDRTQVSSSGTRGPPVPAVLATVPATIGSWWTITLAGLGAAVAYLLPAIWLGEEAMDRG